MAYNSFFANIITRLVLLLGSFIGVAWLLVNTNRFFTIFFLSLIAVVQVISLIYFLNKTNRDLARFLLLLTEEDTSITAWKDRVEKTFRGLHHSFKKVNEEIIRNRVEKEKGNILLQKTIDHIHTGIFIVNEEGEIQLVNEAALRLFDLHPFKNMEDLGSKQDGLVNEFRKLRYDSGNILHLKVEGGDQMPVMVRVASFKLGDQKLRLFSVQEIKSELEANEIESWQKLTRVLAHEISNSITPISTLGTGIHRKLVQAEIDKDGGMHIRKNAASDLLQSSELITQRGNALIEFVDHYKSFSRLPDPSITRSDIREIFENIRRYFSDELTQSGISIQIEVPDDLGSINLDPNLMEQAMINLVRNALSALSDQSEGMISLSASRPVEGEVIIKVSDNGPGISPSIHSQVFIPFFTTKSKGTGIGLSLVRKITNMHGGSIRLQTQEGRGCTFIIKLPQMKQ